MPNIAHVICTKTSGDTLLVTMKEWQLYKGVIHLKTMGHLLNRLVEFLETRGCMTGAHLNSFSETLSELEVTCLLYAIRDGCTKLKIEEILLLNRYEFVRLSILIFSHNCPFISGLKKLSLAIDGAEVRTKKNVAVKQEGRRDEIAA